MEEGGTTGTELPVLPSRSPALVSSSKAAEPERSESRRESLNREGTLTCRFPRTYPATTMQAFLRQILHRRGAQYARTGSIVPFRALVERYHEKCMHGSPRVHTESSLMCRWRGKQYVAQLWQQIR